MNIGVFDSGLGGLTILKAILEKLPEYNYIYIGDNAHVPYGNRSPHLVQHFTENAVKFLFEHDCQLVLIACNTATSVALRYIQQQVLPHTFPDRRVLGVIRPAVEAALESAKQRIGVIATHLTVTSEVFPKEIHKTNPDIKVFQQACPVLVPLIEEGFVSGAEVEIILKHYIHNLQQKQIESLILGCTHYELVESEIAKILGPGVDIISEGKIVANKLESYLQKHIDIKSKLKRESSRTYYVTDLSDEYEKLTHLFLGDYFSPRDKLNEVEI